MNIVHLRRSDKTVDEIVRAAFPSYTGNKVAANIQDMITFHSTNWDGGSKNEYAIVRLADMKVMTVPESPYFSQDNLYTNLHKIPDGVVVVILAHFAGKQSVSIVSPAQNITPFLPAPIELTKDEKTVLMATKGYKSSYGGEKNYRFKEANERTGITLERWEAAKQEMIKRKFLSANGAITVEGKNAIGSDRL